MTNFSRVSRVNVRGFPELGLEFNRVWPFFLSALRISRLTAGAFVVVCQMAACGHGARLYHVFREKTDRVRVGMAESEVLTIMGAPSNSPTGDMLVADCGQASASALVYDVVTAGRFARWAASIIGSHPQIDRLIVCFDANHTVVKKDVLMVMID